MDKSCELFFSGECSLYQEERLRAILDHLDKHQRISVQEICDLFQVSRDTARRDLVKLSEQNAIVRTRGGAVLPLLKKEIQSYSDRLDLQAEVKRKIGQKAASLISSHDYVLMDTSTTVQFCAQAITSSPVVVVTNSIDIADLATRKEGMEVHVLGGQLHLESRYLYGASTLQKLNDYRVHKCFIGGGGITEEGLFVADEEDGQIVRAMIGRAEQVIALVDRSKFGQTLFYKVCGWEAIDLLVTDDIPESMERHLEEMGVEVVRAEE